MHGLGITDIKFLKKAWILLAVFTIGPRLDNDNLLKYAKLISPHDKLSNHIKELVQGIIDKLPNHVKIDAETKIISTQRQGQGRKEEIRVKAEVKVFENEREAEVAGEEEGRVGKKRTCG
ncbi:hypothetical protein AgCh_032493 [Apium graveolens]